MTETPSFRRCSRCKRDLPATAEFFRVNDKRGYFRSTCIECDRLRDRERRADDPGKFRERDRARRLTDPQKFKEKNRKNYLAHYEGRQTYRKEQYWANREERLAASHEWRRQNLERARAYDRQRGRDLKAKMHAAYGGKCECCSLDDSRFLTLEHVDGDGKAHRARMKSSMTLYRRLKDAGWPKEGLTLLCWNCQMARALYGFCPHQRGKPVV